MRAEGVDELLVKTRQRASLLDGFTDYLHHRWAQGAHDAAVLTVELRESTTPVRFTSPTLSAPAPSTAMRLTARAPPEPAVRPSHGLERTR